MWIQSNNCYDSYLSYLTQALKYSPLVWNCSLGGGEYMPELPGDALYGEAGGVLPYDMLSSE